MKLRSITFLLLIFCFFNSCDSNDCEAVVCVPDSAFNFELLDAENNNILDSGVITLSDISIIDLANQSAIDFFRNEVDNRSIIVVNAQSITSGRKTLSVTISNDQLFQLSLETVVTKGECCSVAQFTDLEIQGADFEFDDTRGVYTFIWQ
ncbi:hypothetical protein [uncultured Aquimarina sp.]|uniref:hypothetical protein n=1 Tax=uncultured Aquimarina sp. TaxID=575652 RepID=UPI0026107199|nr:hypothetical protein [uncultured Aquimarina sp.]